MPAPTNFHIFKITEHVDCKPQCHTACCCVLQCCIRICEFSLYPFGKVLDILTFKPCFFINIIDKCSGDRV